MEEITFPFAGTMLDEITMATVEVGECSICGALVRAVGTPERKHIEFHAAVSVVTR